MTKTKNKVFAEELVSMVNNLIEAFCKKYPNEYEFDILSIGYYEEDGFYIIETQDGDDITETIQWINDEVIPDLFNVNKEN